ncbi:MAG: SGNH/GDSL hydrolase family protein [Chloroflexi bacterium]|nr:SGNH/GDSL hydrolase family protein [Chloroflexota bacterium]
MQQILVYGDSLSWGIIPLTRNRHPFEVRWPGVLENQLKKQGQAVRVIEDCLNGRRTVWDDPFKPGRNGLFGLAQRIESHSPLALVILMLGTNDFQSMHPHNAWHSAQGMATLVTAIRQAPIEPGMPIPSVLVVVPPPIQLPKGPLAPKFEGGDTKCAGLAEAYREVTTMLGCHFFDAGTVISVSERDGIHLDAEQHLKLGQSLTQIVQSLIA